ncbi:MAG: ribonuclease III, partial [Xanthomonadaceae bacterium]|nr:ribonuclease III [Xanthomonadaceae bacterium]
MKLGYRFADEALLNLALTHRSAGRPNNERLEFLGDALVNLVVAEMLFDTRQRADEGELSRLRAQLVSEPALAERARGLHLGD